MVVGQGLAGTCLSFELIRHHKKVLVIDQEAGARCSAVAAGTFNPLVFKTFSPTWKAHELLPYLKSFYLDLGSFLNRPILNERSVVKSMKSKDQQRLWNIKSQDEDSRSFMRSELEDNIHGLHSNHGFGLVEQSGNINMLDLLGGFRTWLRENKLLMEEQLDYSLLRVEKDHVSYKEASADHILFCQGLENVGNPFFKKLPFIPAKGEILLIESPELHSQNIIHDRINIVPLEGNIYWVGSTFTWDNLSMEKTTEARVDLVDQLKGILDVPFKVKDHKVGIRPTVKDRRPLIGMHPEHRHVGIFNGLGTRGVMLAPYFAKHFVDHLYHGSDLNREVDIQRFNARG
jgi:glycine/D-amino acid oxidase-like deaminating enzyme